MAAQQAGTHGSSALLGGSWQLAWDQLTLDERIALEAQPFQGDTAP